MRKLTLAIAMLAPALARADGAPPEATALFDQGIKDLRAGNTELACKELAASLAKYPDSGTKGALATCYTKLGKIASAWSLWRDLADTEPDPSLRADAINEGTRLEPRLPRYVIKLQGPAPAGLVVTVNGNAIADPTLPTPLPIDPGPIVAVAHAPDHQDWAATRQATESTVTSIEVPALAPVTRPATVVQAAAPPPASDGAPRHTRHLIGATLGIVGVTGIVVGSVLGLAANSTWNTAKADCGGNIQACPPAQLETSRGHVSDARTDANLATLGFAVGGALVLTGAIVWFTAPSAERSPVALRLTPVIDASGTGLVLSGAW